MFDPPDQAWPGVLLGLEPKTTSTLDDSNAGEFHLPVAGESHRKSDKGKVDEWSAYRFHEMDPLRFNDGVRDMALRENSGHEPDGGNK